jgi:putative long chain acyl-CoA synthase
MIYTRMGPVASTRIEDGLYDCQCIALCVAAGRPDPEDAGAQIPVAAVQLHPHTPLDLDELSRAVQALPEYARPRVVHVVDEIPLTDGFRPIKARAFDDAGTQYTWDSLAQRYEASRDSAPLRPVEVAR